MDFAEIMQWVAFIATIIGGGWATLKIKAWLVPDVDKMEAGVLVETPFGIGRIYWKKGQNIKVSLLEDGAGDYMGLVKDVQLISKAHGVSNLRLDHKPQIEEEDIEKALSKMKEEYSISFPDLGVGEDSFYNKNKGNYTEEENKEALRMLAEEQLKEGLVEAIKEEAEKGSKAHQDALQRIERLRAARLRIRKKKRKVRNRIVKHSRKQNRK